MSRFCSVLFLAWLVATSLSACDNNTELSGNNPYDHHLSYVAQGWAQNSVNATIFRKNSLATYQQQQYIAFYSDDSEVMLGKRPLGTDDWEVAATGYFGRATDAHNGISIMIDGTGYVHMAWDHHVDTLRYARSLAPESLQLGPMMAMVGTDEMAVTYPEFHRLPSGDILFAYRDGSSGNGRLIINQYDHALMQWKRIQSNLLDGEGQRNAYWQIHIGSDSTIHLSWVWRETGDVATNHDMHYARSGNGGISWQSATGNNYSLPMTQQTVDPIWLISQGSNLINQTSITADSNGTPYIATYYRESLTAFTQVHVIYPISKTSSGGEPLEWTSETVSNRQMDFSLSGGGSKSLPISRPQIISDSRNGVHRLHIIYRDSEYDDRAIMASSNLTTGATWQYTVLTDQSVDRWEPSYDTELWRQQSRLHLYVQAVGQIDGEGVDTDRPPSNVQVLEVSLPEVE
ncbi:BNR repeat-containing protein [Granulosicoccus antarcticus]|uniref:Neuraminidase n=1 Tax=Granulosicoccus antarcticus IMCC3135 TaxID=1192854 RepID=A0A2Z2NL29_9GAMM|nr:BNR repeat-containing protein [Granulosicoccus antarcticus]ASJ72142.1 hypothetical protein IMCC3135_10240 [Granulosicoccus antarcticus IMCC3135]